MRSLIAMLVLMVTLATPIALAAPCAGFTDVDDSSGFCVNVEWMRNRGITLGLTPTQYDPNSPVTRLQMAAFMYRLGFQNSFLRGGNAFSATATLGTTDDNAVEVLANNARVMRFEPSNTSPNVIGGSPANSVTVGVRGATIAGGGVPTGGEPESIDAAPNQVMDHYGTVGGGFGNRAGREGEVSLHDASFATVGGGFVNSAQGTFSTVSGGYGNTAAGEFSAIGGGLGNTAVGEQSTVVGGRFNIASGEYSFAAGNQANANANGCFVWGDSSTINQVSCNEPNRFVVRSRGGVFFFAGGSTQATYTGVVLPPGATAWAPASDRSIKENVRIVDTRDVLDRLIAMPVSTWNLKSQDASIRHMGPMAQDFREAFALGESETRISTLDADGVALAAIQGLNAKLEAIVAEQAKENARLRAALADLRSLQEEVASLRAARSRTQRSVTNSGRTYCSWGRRVFCSSSM